MKHSSLNAGGQSRLRLAPLPHLIALKLYAGGLKSKADILELLVRNPSLDLDELRELCQQYRLHGIEDLIREAEPMRYAMPYFPTPKQILRSNAPGWLRKIWAL